MDYLEINKRAWDSRTEVHIESKFYDVAGFIAGNSSLNPIELAQVGDVAGKSLLHLQCHFGQDSLSWSRLGARVTGVDLSSSAIDQAKALASRLKLDAEFINDDVYHFGETNIQRFDIVYTSYGALNWLPDLERWAKIVANSLRDGGQFNLVEFHHFTDLLAGDSYFQKTEPDVEADGTYTENCTGEKALMATWPHSLSEVIGSLVNAGITIEDFQEYPYSPFNCFEGVEYVEGKGYQKLHLGQQVPLVYAIKGRKRA